MKKSIIALAVAGALTAPMVAQADATLYGTLRIQLQEVDGGDLNVNDSMPSRIGVKGSSDLYNGSKAIFQFEQTVDTEAGALGLGRLALIGATGDWGTATIGRQWTPHYLWVTTVSDIATITGATTDFTRLNNTVAYITPDMNGFQAAVVAIADGTEVDMTSGAVVADDNGEDLDAYNIAVKYAANGLKLAASQVHLEAADADVTAFGAGYGMDNWYVGATYSDNEVLDKNRWELSGSMAFGNTTVLATYADIDDQSVADVDGNGYGIEVQQKVGDQATVYAAAVQVDEEIGSDLIRLGYKVTF